MRTDALPLETLEHALLGAKQHALEGSIHYLNRGSQYVNIRYTEHLTETGFSCIG